MARVGRPPLTERRKAETRLEIAREAVRLFKAKGVSATAAEEIAVAAGISLRTLWRYFPSKESCIRPLLTTGIDVTARCLRVWPVGEGVAGLVDEMERHQGELIAHLPILVDLVKLTAIEPALRAIWIQAHCDAEPVFAEALAERAGTSAEDRSIRMRAGMINLALRVAVERHALQAGSDIFVELRAALRVAEQGL